MREDVNLQWRIRARPHGNVKPADFEQVETPIPGLADGQFLLRTLYLGVRPVMRMYMQGLPAAGERPLEIGDVIHGRGVAQVVASRHPGYSVGDIVHGQLGWQTWKASAGSAQERFLRMPASSLPCVHGVGALGMNGFSAYCGLLECGRPVAGETVVVSAAAGGVGSTVVQIARILGCRVVGIAGGPDKCALLTRLGCAAVIDYKNEVVAARLRDLCPDGVDVYFDNVGGDTLAAVLDNLAMGARIILCGSISEYTLAEPYGLTNYTRLRAKNATMQGFFVYNFAELFAQAGAQLARWIEQGELQPVQNIVNGFDNMPAALAALYSGTNTGVQICRVRGEPEECAPLPAAVLRLNE
ncbi:MAG: NADP-dependent oxidoreductase [Gammaproteobacteria bacterium]|jgi:NADPH-dependent curcumin reductase CurA|nr:NADP-dependent oxidoreductase [Gammaproteobacteria bacterium]